LEVLPIHTQSTYSRAGLLFSFKFLWYVLLYFEPLLWCLVYAH
jgi:hypothetical protein